MIKIKMLDNEYMEGILNDLINSTEQLTDLQLRLRSEEEYMKLDALAKGLKKTMAGCPEADLMEAFEDAVFWKSAYEINMAHLEGIKKGFNLRRLLLDETCQRQQANKEEALSGRF